MPGGFSLPPTIHSTNSTLNSTPILEFILHTLGPDPGDERSCIYLINRISTNYSAGVEAEKLDSDLSK
jgi:hypothetical protein